MAQTDSRYFGIWDYVIFSIMLLLSAAIGIYSALSGGRQRTAEEFFLGDRKMHIVPVAMSIVVSFTSAISVIGTPGEIYMFDTMFAWGLVAYVEGNIIISRLFLPIFFRLRITSVYEYLEMRFNRVVRTCCTVIFSIQTVLYMGIAMYTPGLAINAVTGMDLWACVVSTGIVCIFYTTVGGMKAVLWTDTLQAVIILLGVLAVVIKGIIEVGGLGEVWRIGVEGKRLEFLEFSFDPRVRYTVWSLLFGMGTLNVSSGINQTVIQRMLSCGSERKAVQSLVLATVVKIFTVGLCIFSGVVMYAYYVDCDPYTQGVVKSKDQIMPLMVMDLFGNMPGLPGLFLSAVVSASISTLSSGINSLAALSGEDGVRVIWPNIHPQTYATVVKLLAVFYGLVSIGFAFLASILGQGVLSLCLSLIGITNGAMVGTFILGIYMHRSNPKGAVAGLVTAVLFLGWIKGGSMAYPSSRGKNMLSVEGCPAYNNTDSMYTEEITWMETNSSPVFSTFAVDVVEEPVSRPAIAELYSISFLYYGPIGIVISVLVGMIVSACTGLTDPDSIDPKLLHNLADALFCCFPESLRRRMRCGTLKLIPDQDADEMKDIKFPNGPSQNIGEMDIEERRKMLLLDPPPKHPNNHSSIV